MSDDMKRRWKPYEKKQGSGSGNCIGTKTFIGMGFVTSWGGLCVPHVLKLPSGVFLPGWSHKHEDP